MLDRALEEMQKKESKIVSPILPFYSIPNYKAFQESWRVKGFQV
jgi:hypothetical protein